MQLHNAHIGKVSKIITSATTNVHVQSTVFKNVTRVYNVHCTHSHIFEDWTFGSRSNTFFLVASLKAKKNSLFFFPFIVTFSPLCFTSFFSIGLPFSPFLSFPLLLFLPFLMVLILFDFHPWLSCRGGNVDLIPSLLP